MPKIDDEYKERLHDITELLERDYDPKLPVVCLDEKLVELREDVREPLKGRILRRDYEYRRAGTANIFMITEPKGGQHLARITETRKKADFAECLDWLASKYPNAIAIHIVMDNLNTHVESSLVKRYGKVKGARLWARFRPHYTPKHGSWLNPAEIALSVTQRCCLGKQRHGSIESVRKSVEEFWKKRTKERWKIDWKFTTEKAKKWVKTFVSKH